MNLRAVLALPLFALSLASAGCDEEDRSDGRDFCPGRQDLAAYVDPMIGTGGSGNSVPGALVPHGMVKLSPDTNGEPLSVDAYQHENDKIEGFTHTHWQGPGGSGNGYSQILFMPATGPLEADPKDYASAFSHDTEETSPGLYAVTLDDYKVRVMLTATAHAGFHRYVFPASKEARVLIDLGHSLGDSRGGRVEIVDDRTIQGYGEYMVHLLIDMLLNQGETVTGRSRVYFHARFNKPFSSHGTWKPSGAGKPTVNEGSRAESGAWIGAWAGFSTEASEVIEVQVGISMISEEQARRNLEAEIGSMSFEEVSSRARAAWNCLLNRIHVAGGSSAERTKFYTALYHTLMVPADTTEAGGVFYTAADCKGSEFTWKDRRFYTDDWCAWDTFRTSRPLATLVEPETVNDVVASYLHLYEQGGWLPKCTWTASGYSRVMIGNHAVSIIADAFAKGFKGYDLDLAWEAVHKSGTEDNVDPAAVQGLCGYPNLGTTQEYIDKGYVSHECDTSQSVSMTLEYAYNDWCTAQMAKGLGKEDEYNRFMKRSKNYENHWDKGTGFMRGRQSDGSWVEPFDPASTDEMNDFCEASAWIYSWFVPHDVAGLITLMGGNKAFISKLDQFFTEGHFEISNEPSFHVPYLYNHAGAPSKTQTKVREILRRSFSTAADGLPGNDDAGATSAWYVLSAVGIYPISPGSDRYEITSPAFSRVTLHLNPAVYNGKTFTIEAPEASAEKIYIQSAELNGKPLTRSWIRHEEIVGGGELRIRLGPSPSSWAASAN